MTITEADNAEQPVREQLKKTSIQPTDAAATTTPKTLHKKRSHEEIETPTDEAREAKHHARKRSRDSTAEDTGPPQNSIVEGVDEKAASNGSTKEMTPDLAVGKDAVASPKVKRSRLESESKETVDNNGTTNDSASTRGLPQTSSSAFAASGFGALASSKSSGFGALGGAGLSSFASPKKDTTAEPEPESAFGKKPTGTATPSTSVFGGALGAKPAFTSTGNTTSSTFGGGLGKTGGFGSSGFGSLGGAQLSSFASKPGASTFGTAKAKTAKAFGAPADDEVPEGDTEDDADDSGVKSPQSVGTADEDKKDTRFYEQKVETGEENEVVVYQGRAKLYTFTTGDSGKKEWKERGIGNLKLNMSKAPISGKTTVRLLMRADGSHRVVLNSPIQKDLKVQSPQGGAPTPTGGLLSFYGTIDAKVELLQLKMRPVLAIELYEKVRDLQEHM